MHDFAARPPLHLRTRVQGYVDPGWPGNAQASAHGTRAQRSARVTHLYLSRATDVFEARRFYQRNCLAVPFARGARCAGQAARRFHHARPDRLQSDRCDARLCVYVPRAVPGQRPPLQHGLDCHGLDCRSIFILNRGIYFIQSRL